MLRCLILTWVLEFSATHTWLFSIINYSFRVLCLCVPDQTRSASMSQLTSCHKLGHNALIQGSYEVRNRSYSACSGLSCASGSWIIGGVTAGEIFKTQEVPPSSMYVSEGATLEKKKKKKKTSYTRWINCTSGKNEICVFLILSGTAPLKSSRW